MKSANCMTPLGVVEKRASLSSIISWTSAGSTLVLEPRAKISAASFLSLAISALASSIASMKACVIFGLASTNFFGAKVTSSVMLPR